MATPTTSRQAFVPTQAPEKLRTALAFAERVAYQYAIEEVYWRHRIWPKENPAPKPQFDAIVSQRQLERKVEDYVRKSQFVTDQQGSPITARELQAEMERMATHTKQPDVLRELFAALGNDPFVIAECLARPALAERFSADLTAVAGVSPAPRNSFAADTAASTENHIRVTASPDNAQYKLPEVSVPDDCSDDTWTATTAVNAPGARGFHTAVWSGSEMIVWGGFNLSPPYRLNTGGRYNPSTDSWTATTTTNAPAPRDYHSAVWTGTEMIVWGGESTGNPRQVNTGGRYNPATDSWVAVTTANAPDARDSHTAVWTGTEMIVWGGFSDPDTWFNTGGQYNPATDSWTATSTVNAPEARWDHTALWSSSEMIIWGGTNSMNYLHTGGRYNPGTDSWTPTGLANVPLGRVGHTAVWTGSEMIIWGGGGQTFNDTNTGGRYNPSTDSWIATSLGNAPLARDSHSAVWTGSEMIVWGGYYYPPGDDWNTGGRYDPASDGWTPTSTGNAPLAREDHKAVWTGSEMIVWGGFSVELLEYLNTGGRYCAQSPLMAQSAFSRKVHGAAGTFDIALSLTGNVGIECRSGGATNDYQMIINFANPVTVGSASVTSGTGSVSSFSVSGSQVTVNLTGVANVQRITVTLFNVNDGMHMGNVPLSMGVLVGDVNGNAAVNATDVALTKSQVGQPVTGSNFREDVNANGTISSTDVAIVKSDVGTSLPP